MPDVHLLVLIHGMWGNPSHLAHANKIMRDVKGEVEDNGVKLEILVAETNKDESTYDGIDWGGERIAEEVIPLDVVISSYHSHRLQIQQKTAELEKEGRYVTRFSVTGYSLGGLIARYVIGYVNLSPYCDDSTNPG